MLAFIFVPIPAFNFESSKFVLRAYQPVNGNCDRLPVWRKIVLNDLGSSNLDKCIVSSELHEPQVRIAFVPKIKKRIYIFYLLSSPFHRDCHYIKQMSYLMNFKPYLLWLSPYLQSFYFDDHLSLKLKFDELIPSRHQE